MKNILPYLTLFVLIISLVFLINSDKEPSITGFATKEINQSEPDYILELNITNKLRSLMISGTVIQPGKLNVFLKSENLNLLVANISKNQIDFINYTCIETCNFTTNDTKYSLLFYSENASFNLADIKYVYVEE